MQNTTQAVTATERTRVNFGKIPEAMELPSYQAAREYYLTRSNEKWEAVNLLRQADPDAYLEAAKKAAGKKEDLKSAIISLAKNIYRNI